MKTIEFTREMIFLYNLEIVRKTRVSSLISTYFESASQALSDIEFEIREQNTKRG